MTTPQQPLPAGGPGREQAAIAEVEHTTISASVVWLLVAFFLTAITVVPIAEVAIARVRPDRSIAAAWAEIAGIPGEARSYLAQAGGSSVWRRAVSVNRIALTGLSAFERALENESFIGRTLRPPAQRLMTGWLGAGNERVYPGRAGWLFYRPDVEYLTRPGFLDPAEMNRRVAAAPEWTSAPQPDPRKAIAQFKRDLDARGITLIVMPTPLKPGVHPEMLAGRYAGATGVLQNASYAAFVEDLQRAGVLVFDPSSALAAARASGPQYLATDTHWRPETMEMVAGLTADFILAHASLPPAGDPAYRVERVEVRSQGDIARMLDLPEGSALFPPELVWLRRVLEPDGSLWRSSRDADVLLLGDSFSNIYSLESMGWGTSAGFAEQLSYSLRRPVDRLTQNDQGAFATRAMLQQEPGRLDRKRVVIYQFAARELADGDWRITNH
jgi:hypothetical protein